MQPQDEYRYVPSGELRKPVLIRLDSVLEGQAVDRALYGYRETEKPVDLCARVAVYCNGRRVGLEVETAYHASKERSTTQKNDILQNWNDTLALPVMYSELNLDSYIVISFWRPDRDAGEVLLGQAKDTLFDEHGVFRSEARELPIWPPAAVNGISSLPKSPFKGDNSSGPDFTPSVNELALQNRLLKDGLILESFLDLKTQSTIARQMEKARKKKSYLHVSVNYLKALDVRDVKGKSYNIVYNFAEESEIPSVVNPTPSPFDPELGLENVHEVMHQMMTRNMRVLQADTLRIPNKKVKEELDRIIKTPSYFEAQRDLVFRFRYYLRQKPNALTKFIRSVNWDIEEQAEEAEVVIKQWSEIDICDVLELLGPDFRQKNMKSVREYAVTKLRQFKSSEDTIRLYLLQLVQALRYEPQTEDPTLVAKSDLANFLIGCAIEYPTIANFLYWYLRVEVPDYMRGGSGDKPASPDLTPNKNQEVFAAVLHELEARLENNKFSTIIKQQNEFVDELISISNTVKTISGNIEDKRKKLRELLAKSTTLKWQNGLPLPLDPTIRLSEVIPESGHVFKSSQMPISLSFRVHQGGQYSFIFKVGDDLRQDQLIMQMIHIMDSILRRECLNLFLTPYQILAVGPACGFIEYVKAVPVADCGKFFPNVSKTDHILMYLKKHRPCPHGPYGVEKDAMDRFVRSCAGYCVISYLLGIGDRHLHNVLLCEDGRIFHIDFGYILGRDPKPFPPPMKITDSMVEAMGKVGSEHFKQFSEHCRVAFGILQSHARLIANLFALMLDAGIFGIEDDKDKAVQKVLERFHLDIDGKAEDVERLIDQLVQASINALFGKISDFVHDIYQ